MDWETWNVELDKTGGTKRKGISGMGSPEDPSKGSENRSFTKIKGCIGK